jgi:hypothetical protein
MDIWPMAQQLIKYSLQPTTEKKYGICGCLSGDYEQYYFLGHNAIWSIKSQPTFQRNISPPSSWLNKLSKVPV